MSPQYTGQLPEWLEANKTFTKDIFPTLPTPFKMVEQRPLAKPSGIATIVLTCLDPRCVPENYFGPGFAGAVIRNAGGRATDDAIRSVTLLRGLINASTVVVVHHTDCGVTHMHPSEIIDTVASKAGAEAKAAAEKIDYKLFPAEQLEESVREDVQVLRAAPTLKGVNVFGFRLETFTGEVTPVTV